MDKFKKAGEILNQGAEYLGSGKTDQAIKIFLKALKIENRLVAAHFNLALAYHQKGKTLKAIDSLEKTVKLKPDDFEAHNLVGHLYMTQGKANKALPHFKKAIAINPFLVEGFYNLGVCLMAKGQYQEALKNYRQSLKLFPDDSIVLNNMGVAFEKIAQQDKAMTYYKKALKIDPQNAMALANIGATLIFINPKKARRYFEKAVAADPNMDNAVYNLGVCLRLLGDAEGSIECFEKVLQLNPNFSPTYGLLYHQFRETCDWERAKAMESQMKKLTSEDIRRGLIPAETIFVSAVYDDNPKRNHQIAQAWSRHIEEKVAPYHHPYSFGKRPHSAKATRGKKIRLGYLSNDFRNHATSHLMMGLFRLHDRKKFQIYLYSYGEDDQSRYRKELEKITAFRDVLTLSHRQVADLIYQDKIDILVDLKGHTTSSRLEIPALRPAPIQVNYLGFPGTSGARFFDYFITDKIVTPKEHRSYYTEKLILMPHSYQVNDNQQPISKKIKSRSQLMLPEKAFLFCAFLQPYKISPNVFDSWARILKAVPNSFLCLLAKTNSQTENLKREALKRMFNPARLIFCLSLKKEIHLARLKLCDLALDTFVCNGHTSTSDALWAGLPVVTLLGKHFASRVSASLLTAIGLPELIAKDQIEYEMKAITLAKNPARLKALKGKLARNRLTQPLFDTKKFTRHLEEAYTKIWEIYRKGKKPQAVVIDD